LLTLQGSNCTACSGPGSTEKLIYMQLDDVKNLLKEKIDLKYIKEWSVKLGIDKLLQGVINE